MTSLTTTGLALIFVLLCPALSLAQSVRFAVIGDYGRAGQAEADVATLVKSWNTDFVITVGDNNYEYGAASTIDANIGQYYSSFIYPYKGTYGEGHTSNSFLPSLGNHDWIDPGASAYMDYFELPGNERYYDVVWGPVQLFALDSDGHEPDGATSSSTQARWLQNKLDSSKATWKLVYFHHPPYSSGSHGSSSSMQWPFQSWGATAVLAGHDHHYERIIRNNFPYFVNGLGGKSRYSFGTTVSGSVVRYNADYGAMLVEANEDSITFQFFTRTNALIDRYVMRKVSTGLDEPMDAGPHHLILEQNYPNPFNPKTELRFEIEEGGFVNLKIVDILGREITTLVSEMKQPGSYTVPWNASGQPGLTSGSYFARITNGRSTIIRKILLVK
ncbi:MAG TPA: metallophosphoesterase [Bacteroidota bacterium]|nr:metallophosphoesterase [Bacteroidota bacterium]